MSIAEMISEIEDEPTVPLSKLEESRRTVASLKRQVGRLEAEKTEAVQKLEEFLSFGESKLEIPEWLDVRSSSKVKRGVATLFLSDTHFDEVVNPTEVEGLNAYNRQIATMRLRTAFQKASLMTSEYVTGVKCESAVLLLGGDMVGGMIHEELAQSNEAFLTETVMYWTAELAAGIEHLKKEYKKVHVTGVVGNHGRMTAKPRHKGRVKDNWDWLIYKILEREFRNDKNVTFAIPDSPDITLEIAGHRFRLTHGDQFSGGGGQTGVAVPMTSGDRKKRQLAMATDNPYRYLCFSADTTVVTETGVKFISDVKVGDMVLTHAGNWKPVYEVKQRSSETIVVKGAGHPGIVTTPEHPFLTSERISKTGSSFLDAEWTEAKDLLGKFWHSPASPPKASEIVELTFEGDNNREFTQDDVFWFVVGLWLADGHLIKKKTEAGNYLQGISLSLNVAQRDHFEDLLSNSDMKFSVIDKSEKGIVLFQCYSNPLAVWLRENFGEYATGKTTPGWVLSLPESSRKSLLDGYLYGDGHYPQDYRWEASTVSKRLAIGIKLLAQTLGQHTSLFYDDRGGTEGSVNGVAFIQKSRWKVKAIEAPKRYVGTYFVDGNMLGRVKSVTDGEEQVVYNLSVVDDESFVADGLIVHNCMGHFHSFAIYNNIVVNGSSKGYDEYAYNNGFIYGEPSQAFWVTTPEHGITFPIELMVGNREKEGW